MSGLAVGTIYRHFPNKEELIAAVMEEAVGEFGQATESGLAPTDALGGLETFVHGGVAVLAGYGELVAAQLEGRVPEQCR